MNGQLRALVQNAISILPSDLSYRLYYCVQRRFGGLRNLDPTPWLTTGAAVFSRLRQLGFEPRGRTFFEVGTGRAPLLPMTYWLLGAGRTRTVDLNPYLKGEMVAECLAWIAARENQVRGYLGEAMDEGRFSALLALAGGNFDLGRFLDLTSIEYLAPADAAATGLPARSIDFHTSYTVLEHIAEPVLERILAEGRRLLRPEGAFVHLVDFSDHFSHSDPNLSSANFLRFSNRAWRLYSGNRYMYMNRLRYDDYQRLFAAVSDLIFCSPVTDPKALALLQSGALRAAPGFQSKPLEVLAIMNSWFVSTPREDQVGRARVGREAKTTMPPRLQPTM